MLGEELANEDIAINPGDGNLLEIELEVQQLESNIVLPPPGHGAKPWMCIQSIGPRICLLAIPMV